MNSFKLVSQFAPAGDQPQAIAKLTEGVLAQKKEQVLLGVTGSGKTFTMANVIANTGLPTLILAHNKTLAGQLYEEFKLLFPENAVEYFVSYYDYYQPEAYIARTDTYIEKDMAINDRIDRLRLSATKALLERKDVVIVASVSCIYGLGLPDYYAQMRTQISVGDPWPERTLARRLTAMHYERATVDFVRGTFRQKGDVFEIFPAYEEEVSIRIELFDGIVERISEVDPLTFKLIKRLETIHLYPASHHVIPEDVRERALAAIKEEMLARREFFDGQERFVESQRIHERTMEDIENIKELGYCKGIENYSRHFAERAPGSAPSCLLDYFQGPFLTIIDESHQTLPQLHAMYNGDRARKSALVEFGFRLPCAYDNRPLAFDEAYARFKQIVYVSATPGEWELAQVNGEVVEQVIRPTGLIDPEITVRPASMQVDDCLHEIRIELARGNRVLVTTLTKHLAEEFSAYLENLGLKAKYMHSDITTLERMEILRDLREGQIDILVGINLLREGLDLPEVSLVAIFDADKEGFLRSTSALIQTCGRAARNVQGRVLMYADKITRSMKGCIEETERRRKLQIAYNKEHNITPRSASRNKASPLALSEVDVVLEAEKEKIHTPKELRERIWETEVAMKKAAKELDFQEAARLRDLLNGLKRLEMTL